MAEKPRSERGYGEVKKGGSDFQAVLVQQGLEIIQKPAMTHL
jgi:hypothetical protein